MEDIKLIMQKHMINKFIPNIELFASVGAFFGGLAFLNYFGNKEFLFNFFITTYGGFIGGISGVTFRAIIG